MSKSFIIILLVLLLLCDYATDAFVPLAAVTRKMDSVDSELRMIFDPVTSLRTEWVSAALCTNQI
jgi:hypothetical protein